MARKLRDFSGEMDKIRNALFDDKPKKTYDKSDEFVLKADEKGVASAIIRFLPQPVGETLPYVKLMNHGFKSGQKWFIENCPTTIGKDCPVVQSRSVVAY